MPSHRPREQSCPLLRSDSSRRTDGGVFSEKRTAGGPIYQGSDIQRHRDAIGPGAPIRIGSAEHADADRRRERRPARVRRKTPGELESAMTRAFARAVQSSRFEVQRRLGGSTSRGTGLNLKLELGKLNKMSRWRVPCLTRS